MFYFVRHGQPDYSEKGTKIYQGFGVNLAPLTEVGVSQIKETSKDVRLKDADIILSSPYTRALQTAAILSRELNVDIIVETNLHEWVGNKDYIYDEDKVAVNSFKEYEKNNGVYPQGEEKRWEDADNIRKRVRSVLEKYQGYNKVIVACHGVVIQAMTGKNHPHHGEIVEFELK